MRWFDLMRLPLALFSLGAEMFAATMREFQRALTRAMDAPTSGVASTESPGGGSADKQQGDTNMPNWSRSDRRDYDGGNSRSADSAGCDTQSMGAQDLGGTELKYVEWSILFTKRDLEATLKPLQTDLIDYETNGASFGALKMGQFLSKDFTAGIVRPDIWLARHYPPKLHHDQPMVKLSEIPEPDLRYLTFVFKVKDRLARQSKEYEREEVEALQRCSRCGASVEPRRRGEADGQGPGGWQHYSDPRWHHRQYGSASDERRRGSSPATRGDRPDRDPRSEMPPYLDTYERDVRLRPESPPA